MGSWELSSSSSSPRYVQNGRFRRFSINEVILQKAWLDEKHFSKKLSKVTRQCLWHYNLLLVRGCHLILICSSQWPLVVLMSRSSWCLHATRDQLLNQRSTSDGARYLTLLTNNSRESDTYRNQSWCCSVLLNLRFNLDQFSIDWCKMIRNA